MVVSECGQMGENDERVARPALTGGEGSFESLVHTTVAQVPQGFVVAEPTEEATGRYRKKARDGLGYGRVTA